MVYITKTLKCGPRRRIPSILVRLTQYFINRDHLFLGILRKE